MELYDESLSVDEINALDIERLKRLAEAGIDEQKVLREARENLNSWQNYFNENIVRGKDDLNFTLRDQWTAIERSEFTRLFKPAMTFNKIYDAVKKVVGEQRKNKPDLLVRSLTGKASQEQINLRADLVRTISYQSQNDLVYQAAYKSALIMGYGAYQIDIDYESALSFNKVIKYLMIPDPTHCSWDPAAIKPHKGDGNFCSRNYTYSKEEFAATYPYITNPVSYTDTRTQLDFQWETRDSITFCDYYVKEWFPVKVYKLSTGETVTESDWKEMQPDIKKRKAIAADAQVVGKLILDDIPHIVMERVTQDYRIMNYRLIQNQIIDFRVWPSKYLPIPFVDGDSHYIEGRQYTKSFVHEARDAQKFINYVGSEIAAEIKNRRREQWIGTPDNIIGNEQMWRNPELQMGILIAKPDPKTGMMPEKMNPWDLSPALMENFQRGSQDIKEIMGFSESEELQGRDISGAARRERKMEGSLSAAVFQSNLDQAIEQGGRIVLDLLPDVMGEHERHVVISKVDGKTKSVVLNKKMPDGSIQNELTYGDYDIEIDTGPSFAVQKEVALEFLQETMQTYPQAFPLIADLWAKNLDVQFMPQMAERFQTLVPPQILAKENGEPPPPAQPNPQQMMMQMEMKTQQSEIQERQAKIAQAQQKLKLDQERLELDKQELLMKAHEMSQNNRQDERDHQLDMHETQLDYKAKMAKIMADIHMNREKAKADARKPKPKGKSNAVSKGKSRKK